MWLVKKIQDLRLEKHVEELKSNKVNALDRHELVKFLESEGREVHNFESTESLREEALTLLQAGKNLLEKNQ